MSTITRYIKDPANTVPFVVFKCIGCDTFTPPHTDLKLTEGEVTEYDPKQTYKKECQLCDGTSYGSVYDSVVYVFTRVCWCCGEDYWFFRRRDDSGKHFFECTACSFPMDGSCREIWYRCSLKNYSHVDDEVDIDKVWDEWKRQNIRVKERFTGVRACIEV